MACPMGSEHNSVGICRLSLGLCGRRECGTPAATSCTPSCCCSMPPHCWRWLLTDCLDSMLCQVTTSACCATLSTFSASSVAEHQHQLFSAANTASDQRLRRCWIFRRCWASWMRMRCGTPPRCANIQFFSLTQLVGVLTGLFIKSCYYP